MRPLLAIVVLTLSLFGCGEKKPEAAVQCSAHTDAASCVADTACNWQTDRAECKPAEAPRTPAPGPNPITTAPPSSGQ